MRPMEYRVRRMEGEPESSAAGMSVLWKAPRNPDARSRSTVSRGVPRNSVKCEERGCVCSDG